MKKLNVLKMFIFTGIMIVSIYLFGLAIAQELPKTVWQIITFILWTFGIFVVCRDKTK